MKIFFLGIFLSLNAGAVTLEKSLSLPEGKMKQTIEWDKEKLKLFKDSNYFDSPKAYRIGNFTAPIKGQQKTISSLEELLKKVEAVDEALKKKGTSFNQLSIPKAHVTIYRLNEFVIGPGSKYYQILDDHFKHLGKLQWKQIDGYEISRDFKTVKEFEGGKLKKTSEFASDFFCKRDMCTYTGGGTILR